MQTGRRYIAKRLSKSITKETATVRNILDNYNSILSTIGDETCSLQDVLLSSGIKIKHSHDMEHKERPHSSISTVEEKQRRACPP